MTSSEYTRGLFIAESNIKIVLVVVDGLGGLPHPNTGLSELETAAVPNLDRLAGAGSCGLLSPMAPGITPGSGPAHLALFGYDPWENVIGRGALSALGLRLPFAPGDVAARLNFCTIDAAGLVTDRRAGRIPTDECLRLCELMKEIEVDGVELSVMPEREYRAAVVFRGEGLSDGISDSDPQVTGVAPRAMEPRTHKDAKMARVATEFARQARQLLHGEQPANMVLIRGFGGYPQVPQMRDVYGLRAHAIAVYPMYRGVARAVGMEITDEGVDLDSQLRILRESWEAFDFFYLHVKAPDSAGEDGDFARKVSLLQEVDGWVAQLEKLDPGVLIVTGDHSTPAIMRGHSWHPVPVVISSPWSIPIAAAAQFTERACALGSIGQIPSTSLMALALAHARRLQKFGA
jgi:2,3-bisphosphoglycerate-independent phosphoglycerate mutase